MLCEHFGLPGGVELEPPNRRWMAQLLRWADKPPEDGEAPHWQVPAPDEDDEE